MKYIRLMNLVQTRKKKVNIKQNKIAVNTLPESRGKSKIHVKINFK